MSQEHLERIKALELENQILKQRLQKSELNRADEVLNSEFCTSSDEPLSLDEYARYGRQMIVPEFGSLKSQMKLKKSKVLVIGAGGLGCPALLYISAAGIGEIGIIDNDLVDVSNLHRQILHTTDSVGMHKCDSAKKYINKLNPHVKVTTYPVRLSTSNAIEIIKQYDLILDCTDTPSTRYLINDASVVCGKTIISGSGLKSDGQLSILGFQGVGPCYRCFYPKAPSPESVTTCSDGGVLGPAIGLVGIAMALETIKVLTDYYTKKNFRPFLSSYSGFPQQQIRVFKMRGKQTNCAVCGSNPTINENSIVKNEIDYIAFCGRIESKPLSPELRVEVEEYKSLMSSNHVLLDVRPKEQFGIVKLPNSINIEWDPVFRKAENIDSFLPKAFNKDTDSVYVVCRFGNDSQLAARKLIDDFHFKHVKDIRGGLQKWSEIIDPEFPKY